MAAYVMDPLEVFPHEIFKGFLIQEVIKIVKFLHF